MAPFLDPSTLAQLESLPVKARMIVEGALSGLHRARLHGSSVEFADHKEYTPGDDIRHIDWKAYAKADRYYVKQFEQESELTAYLLLDASGSMSYKGEGISKLEYASYLMASLAYLLIKQRDKCGLFVFGDDSLDRYVPPRARPAHLHDLLSVIEDANQRGASGAESLSTAVDRIAELSRRRRSLIIVASDLFDASSDALNVLRRLRARNHDVALFHVLDRHELELPFSGLTLFRALESTGKLLANPEAIRRRYKDKLDGFLSNVEQTCQNSGIEYHTAPTDRALDRTLLDFLIRRARGVAPTTEDSWNS